MPRLRKRPTETAKPGLVLPQGICVAPPSSTAQKPEANEREQIRFHLRPTGWPKDTVVILGAGSVHLRKGVDLFIACAKRVLEMAPKQRFRFVWIGDGFDPEHDGAYSVYLEDQIDRSNLGEAFSILEAVADIERAYLRVGYSVSKLTAGSIAFGLNGCALSWKTAGMLRVDYRYR